MAYNTVRYDLVSGAATITLSRPDELNAYTTEMMWELTDAFDVSDEDDDVRAVIVTGEGRAFSAGLTERAHAIGEELECAAPEPFICGVHEVLSGPGTDPRGWIGRLQASEAL
jgi:enoyl-CoA hydratase/carnithine racemase